MDPPWSQSVLQKPVCLSRPGATHTVASVTLSYGVCVCGGVLCVVGCLAAPLASTHSTPGARPSVVTTSNGSRQCQCPWEGEANGPRRRTTYSEVLLH